MYIKIKIMYQRQTAINLDRMSQSRKPGYVHIVLNQNYSLLKTITLIIQNL